MTARWTNVQAVLVSIIGIFLIVTGDLWLGVFAVGATAAVAAFYLTLNALYVRRLAGRPRSLRRAGEDAAVARGLLVVGIVVLVVFLGRSALRLPWLPEFLRLDGGVTQFISIPGLSSILLLAGFCSIYLSSLIDRFIIVPWVDGTLGIMPFEDTRPHREDMTRLWLWHRIVCTALFFVGLWAISGLIYFTAMQSADGYNWAEYFIGLFSPSIIPAIVMQGWIAGVPAAVNLGFGHIDLCVGDYVERKRGGAVLTGIIVEASVDKALTVVAPDGDVWILPLKDARPDDDVHRAAPAESVDWRQAIRLADIGRDDFSAEKVVPTTGRFAF